MRRFQTALGLVLLFLAGFVAGSGADAGASEQARILSTGTNAMPIDLPTVLRLAGARNLDIQMARQRLLESRANADQSIFQLFPWISPGVTYRRHDDLIQDVQGNLIDTHKHSEEPGATLNLQADIGEGVFKALQARQTAVAAQHALHSQEQDSVLAAVQAYFDLAKAQSAVAVAKDAVEISQAYETQLHQVVQLGLAFQGDELRVRVQTDRNRISLRQAIEHQQGAAARLATTLHLYAGVHLLATDSGLLAMPCSESHLPVGTLVAQAIATRPELKQSGALIAAAKAEKNGAIYGPLIPSIGGQAYLGELMGGINGLPGRSGPSEDYAAVAGWRIGPGGLLDFPRIKAAKARVTVAILGASKASDEIAREVVESVARTQSLEDQLKIAQRMVENSKRVLALSRERKQFDVANVLENIQAEQDYTRARADYLEAVAERNKAQFALLKAIGRLGRGVAPSAPER